MIIHGGARYAGVNKIMVFIDGGYLRRQLKEFFGRDNLDYLKFVNSLTSWTSQGNVLNKLIRAFYYDATINMKELDDWVEQMNLDDIDYNQIETKRVAQENYLDTIRGQDSIHVREGSLIFSGKEGFRQKGVDTLIAVDMITKAYQDQYDEALLVAGDRDLVEVVESVKNVGPRIVGVYFEGHISKELKNCFDRRYVLTRKKIQEFLPNTPNLT